jgi:hypothetical protein
MPSCPGQRPSRLSVGCLISKEAQQGAPRGRVDDLVDAQKREGVFRVVTVEVGLVDTHSPLAGFLGYKHRVSEPNRVFTFMDDSGS